jgi:hypothetical protein
LNIDKDDPVLVFFYFLFLILVFTVARIYEDEINDIDPRDKKIKNRCKILISGILRLLFGKPPNKG